MEVHIVNQVCAGTWEALKISVKGLSNFFCDLAAGSILNEKMHGLRFIGQIVVVMLSHCAAHSRRCPLLPPRTGVHNNAAVPQRFSLREDKKARIRSATYRSRTRYQSKCGSSPSPNPRFRMLPLVFPEFHIRNPRARKRSIWVILSQSLRSSRATGRLNRNIVSVHAL